MRTIYHDYVFDVELDDDGDIVIMSNQEYSVEVESILKLADFLWKRENLLATVIPSLLRASARS